MKRLTVSDLALSGLKLVERRRMDDARGSLSRIFCREELLVAGWVHPIAQVNHTVTKRRGTIRGMHYQIAPQADMKLVSCIRGEVWDVAVDVRSESKTFLKWHGERLSAANGRALLIPEGFAHGFQSTTDDAELLYIHSAFYSPEAEMGLNATDPRLAIDWPFEITELSPRDAKHPFLGERPEGTAR